MKKTIRISAIAMSFAITTIAHAQIISTVAGTGIAGYSGDGSAATAAKLNQSHSVKTDGAGTIYIADYGNNCIHKVSGGIISTIAGTGVGGYSGDGGAATNAKLLNPTDVTLDASGNVYVVDHNNNVIRKISTSGIISTVAGTGVAGYGGDGAAATTAKLNSPLGMCIDASGNIYIGDQLNHRVRKINTAGIISTIAGTGTAGFSGDGFAATAAKLNVPNFVALDPSGNVVFSDNANHRLRKINSSGIISTIAGNGIGTYTADGVPASATSIFFPGGLEFDAAGNLYFAENGDERIRKIDVTGIINTIAGTGVAGYSGDGGAATAAKLNSVTDVSVDGSGNVYIADRNNNCIRLVSSGSKPYFTAGHTQTLTVCQDVTGVSINTQLAIMDADIANTEKWTLFTAPTHGTAIVAYTATSTGSAITPTGLSYTPTLGYTGTDLIKVIINDGTASDTTTINIKIDPLPDAGTISGIDSVCPGSTVTLSETVTGGIWSSSASFISSITDSGVVKGVVPGRDTIIYTVVNACGIVSAIFPFKVLPYGSCPSLMIVNAVGSDDIIVYPNPNSGKFTVEIRTINEEQTLINIVNILGQRIKEVTIPSNKPTDIALDIPSGIYMLNATTSGQQWSKKIMVNTGR
ncbi:MAG: C-terminal target protein [Flavipsychrobacter sp.]|nr:C-terminal target protein [Flavipsychrobacter sp.]